MSSEIAVSVEGVSKRYDLFSRPVERLCHLLFGLKSRRHQQFYALSDVAFEVGRGETLAIIGKNGAGKSTLLQIICGTLSCSKGTVQVEGKVAALLELGAGFNPEFTGRENVYMKAAIYGLNREETNNVLPQILAFAEIGEFIDQPVKTYSSGMFVRLAFAVIAHLKADILIIDEALAVGDVYFTQKCMRFLREFAKTGTLLFVSHDTHTVVNLCDRAIWLDKGRVMAQGGAKKVCDAYLASFFENNLQKMNQQAEEDVGLAQSDSEHDYLAEFGLGGAKITNVVLLNESGEPLLLLDRQCRVRLRVTCRAMETIESPIIGFFIKDRVGQMLLGENSLQYANDLIPMAAGNRYQFEFFFMMPHLATGEYSIGVAVGAGTQKDHVQHHWIHDAISFKAMAPPELTGIMALQQVSCTVTCCDLKTATS